MGKSARQWLPPIAGLIVMLTFARLGFWQLARAAEKDAIEAGFASRTDAPVLRLDRFAAQANFQPVLLRGRFVADRMLLLDNQVRESRPGVHVFGLFEPSQGGPAVLVNRGWRDFSGRIMPSLDAITAPPGELQLAGFLNAPPGAGLQLGEQLLDDKPVQLVTRVELDKLASWSGRALASQVLLATGPEAFTHDWQPTFMPASRHRGYAFQWFALATTVLIVTVSLQWRGRRRQTA